MAQTIPPSMTPAPTPVPQRGDRATFSDRVDAFVTWQALAVTEFGALASNVYGNAQDAYASSLASLAQANNAAVQANNAAVQANNAALSATSAAVAANAAAWVNGNTYDINQAAISQVNFLTYRKKTASSITTIDPSQDSTNWASLIADVTVKRSVRTSNAILTAADNSALVTYSSGTFTQTFTAASTLGNGWFCYLKNSGTGNVTLDPNSSELIDGLSSFIMYPNEARLIVCDGVGFYSIVISPFYKVFETSGTFVKPSGYSMFGAEAWGGGASGGCYSSTGILVYGGGGGGYSVAQFKSSQLAVTETVTIGAGGNAQSSGGFQNGLAGGNTTFGTLLTATGAGTTTGGYGLGMSSGTIGGSTGLIHLVIAAYVSGNIHGYYGGATSYPGATPARTIYGGACGASRDGSGVAGVVGTTVYGGAGGLSAYNANATAGTAPGGGGGAVQYDTGTPLSGAGGRGELRIWGVV